MANQSNGLQISICETRRISCIEHKYVRIGKRLHYTQNGCLFRTAKRKFELAKTIGFKSVKHQSFVDTSYFDAVQNTVAGGVSSTTALEESIEASQFNKHAA
jgi:hypothetical protein